MSAYIKALSLLFITFMLGACGDGGGSSTNNNPAGGGATTYSAGGSISGLDSGKNVILQVNGGDDLSLKINGAYSFSAVLADGAAYSVTVLTQPAGQYCAVANASGTVSGADVTNVAVDCIDPPAAPSLALGYGIKRLKFSWNTVNGADYYKLSENPDGVSGYSQVGGDLTTSSYDHDIALYRRVNASYILEACNNAGCTGSTTVSVSANLVEAIGYLKASNADIGDALGEAVALSGDGKTLAVGVKQEDSNTTGVNPGAAAEANNTADEAGAVYVFALDANGWEQQAYLKGSNTEKGDEFGVAVALSQNGSRLVVGADGEDSSAKAGDLIKSEGNTIPGDSSGAAYVFDRSATGNWGEQAYIKASNTGVGDSFGYAVAISDDGLVLAVSAPWEDSSATTVNGVQTDNNKGDSGAVYVYDYVNNGWTVTPTYIKPTNTDTGDNFGETIALSGDGKTLAVGVRNEDSNGGGINPLIN